MSPEGPPAFSQEEEWKEGHAKRSSSCKGMLALLNKEVRTVGARVLSGSSMGGGRQERKAEAGCVGRGVVSGSRMSLQCLMEHPHREVLKADD